MMTAARPRNVLMVSNYPSDTGYAWWLMQHFWTLLGGRFLSGGGKAFVAYPRITALPTSLINAGIKAVELTLPWDTEVQKGEALAFIHDHDIDVIYFTDRPWFSTQYGVLRRHGVKSIVVHDHTPGDRPSVGGVKGILKSLRNRLPLVCADWVFVVSPLMRQRNLTNGRVPAERCLVVQNGIPVIPPSRLSSDVRREFGLAPDTIVVVSTGRAHPYKRFDLIIRTAHKVAERAGDLDIVFLLVGDGPAMSDLERLAEEHSPVGKVRLLGFRADTRDIVHAADMAMHAALGEGFSLSIVEYMQAGLPVLVPDIPSVSQAVEHGVTGMVYGRDDVDEAASQVIDLARNKAKRETLGRAAREVAMNRYTLEQCSEAFQAACRQAFTGL